jgi:hypothetical protein
MGDCDQQRCHDPLTLRARGRPLASGTTPLRTMPFEHNTVTRAPPASSLQGLARGH